MVSLFEVVLFNIKIGCDKELDIQSHTGSLAHKLRGSDLVSLLVIAFRDPHIPYSFYTGEPFLQTLWSQVRWLQNFNVTIVILISEGSYLSFLYFLETFYVTLSLIFLGFFVLCNVIVFSYMVVAVKSLIFHILVTGFLFLPRFTPSF